MLAVPIVLVTIVVLGVLAGPGSARAQGQSQEFTTTEKAGDFMAMAFIEARDGSTAYCLDLEKRAPTAGSWQPYRPAGDVDNDLAYVALNGWPRTTTIAGHALTDREARAATQIAVWMLRGSVKEDGTFYGGNFTSSQNGVEVVAAARDLVAAARADATDYGGSGIVMFSPDPATPDTDAYQTIMYVPALGTIAVDKDSADPTISDGNPLYRLAGLSYGVYDSERAAVDSKGDPAAPRSHTITLDEQGRGTAGGVEHGTWWVRELDDDARRASGYALDENVYRVDVRIGSTADDPDWVHASSGSNPTDTPLGSSVGVVIKKVDAQTGGSVAQGAGSLEGAEFTIDYYAGAYASEQELPESPTRRWVVRTGADGLASLDEGHRIGGDEPYRDGSGAVMIPLGTVAIRETKAPEGYLASDETMVIPVRVDGGNGTVAPFAVVSMGNRAIRGDIRFNKIAFPDQRRMGSVPFLVTSLTTGERHVIVTDENGSFDSSASWTAHTLRTNANDALLNESGSGIGNSDALDPGAGVWFGGRVGDGAAAADDETGAFPFDAYSFQELRSKANEGLQLVSFTVSVSRDGVNLDMGTVSDSSPSIATSLTGGEGSKRLEPAQGAKLVDEVRYAGLIAGERYELELSLYDTQEQDLVRDGRGEPLRTRHGFTPQASSGSENVPMTIDTTGFAGRRLVALERLYDATGTQIASHIDENSQEQSVTIEQVEPPASPDDPEVPQEPEAPEEETRNLPRTGVGAIPIGAAAAGVLAACAGLMALVWSRHAPRGSRLGGVGRRRR